MFDQAVDEWDHLTASFVGPADSGTREHFSTVTIAVGSITD